MRKNIVKRKRKNIFELLGIKQDNKKWITLIITLLLMGYLIFCLTYAPISCMINIKASAEETIYPNLDGGNYVNVYTTDTENKFNIELPTIYMAHYNRYVFASTTIKYVMNTNNDYLMIYEPQNGIESYELYELSNYNENIDGGNIGVVELYGVKYDIYDQTNKIQSITYNLYRKQVGTIKLDGIKYFKIIQDAGAVVPVKIRIVTDENNYLEYGLNTSTTPYMPYWDVQNNVDFEITKGLFVYKDRNDITGQYSKDYWEQYFINNETFKNTYRDYWYDYYYQSIYNQGLEAGQTYSEMTFYTLIDAVTFGAIKPIYSILNFELLGINMWNLATSIFTILIVVIIIKFIGMVV